MANTPIEFELQDQFKGTYSNAVCKGQVVVLCWADKDGSAFIGPWAKSIQAEFPEVYFLSVADLAVVPRLLRWMIIAMLPKDRTNPVTLDWSGAFNKAYKCQAGKANVIVFDCEAKLVYRAALGPMASEPATAHEELLAAVRSTCAAPQHQAA